MNQVQRLAAFLNIRAGEGWPTLLLFGHSFFYGASVVFSYTVAISLFLAEFGAERLPFIYLAAAVIVTGMGYVYTRLEALLPVRRLFAGTLLFLLVTAVLFRLSAAVVTASWLFFALLIWFRLLYALTGLEFWGLAGNMFTLQQGKRLFGLIGSGEMIAYVVGYASVSLLVQGVGTINLLWFAAGSLAGSLVMLLFLPQPAQAAPPGRRQENEKGGMKTAVFQNRYTQLIFLTAMLTIIGYFLIDFGFYGQVRQQYSDVDALAIFVSRFYTVVYSLGFISRAFVAGWLLNRFGLRLGLLILPATITLLVLAITATGAMGGLNFIFWLMMGTKLADEVLQSTIYRPALQLLYQPFPLSQRLATQTMAESIAAPVGIGLAGLLLLLFNLIEGATIVWLAAFMLVLASGWVVISFGTFRQYTAVLQQALARRVLEGSMLSLNDASSVNIIKSKLASKHPGEVIYALELLERANELAVLQEAIVPLLAHPEAMVRREAALRIERLDCSAALPAIQKRLEIEAEVEVRVAVLQTLCHLNQDDFIDEMTAFMSDPDPQMRIGAVVGLLRSGGIEGVLVAGQQMIEMVNSPQVAERALGAQLLGAVGARRFYRPLIKLIQDEDGQVRRAALSAAGQVRNENLWPLVIAAIASPEVRGTAVAALIAGGESALPTIETELARGNPAVLRHLLPVCSHIRSPQIIPILADKIGFSAPEMRTEIHKALSLNGYQPETKAGRTAVEAQIEAEVQQAAQILAWLTGFGADEEMAIVGDALRSELDHNRERLFYLLSFLYDPAAVLRARNHLRHPSAEKRAYALEVLDLSLAQAMKELVFPLIDETTADLQRLRLARQYARTDLSLAERLVGMMGCSDGTLSEWPRACAVYAAGRLGLADLHDVVSSLVDSGPDLLRETAVWALARLKDAPPNGERSMLLTLEKVIILKTLSTFSQIPDEILAEIASRLEELSISESETLFEKGDYGDSMYIIVEGEVRVHDGERTLNYLGERDVFGEMAILDPAPRVASITATKETRLLRLNQEPLYELMSERTEVAQGIIRVLSRHLRDRVQDINDLRAQLEAVSGDR
jgi:HEAT repeat protein